MLVEQRAEERDRLRGGVELRPGIAELMSDLAHPGIGLGLAANQPARAVGALDRLGVGQFLGHREVSGTNALRKPDVRVFLQACAALEVKPEDTMLIGDRIDIDIAPAKSLGMTTVRFLWGRHMSQTPRSWSEVPDVEVSDTQGLRHALGSLGLV